jgi:predicted esterase
MERIKTIREVLISGKTSFKIEVPYRLIETGKKGVRKPMMVYLHGYGSNIKTFAKSCGPLMDIQAYHLFIQGPYPLYDRTGRNTVSNWGHAWYLYDGKRKQFIKSLEITSEFIQEILDNLIKFIDVSRLCVLGYSMGGYLAGYFSLTRWKYVNDLIVAGARIKTEILQESDWDNLNHMNILAVHGINDDKTDYRNQKKEIELFQKKNISAKMVLLNEGHAFGDHYVSGIINWMKENGYKEL